MKRHYYDALTLRAELDAFEAKYGMSSEVHYEARYHDPEIPRGITPFDSHVWADTYREWRRLRVSCPGI